MVPNEYQVSIDELGTIQQPKADKEVTDDAAECWYLNTIIETCSNHECNITQFTEQHIDETPNDENEGSRTK
jgi:hypothetical protein